MRPLLLASLLLILLMPSAMVFSEVEQAILKWNPTACNHNCPGLLQARLQQAKGVSSVEMHAEEGWAAMAWDPKIPFSFVPLNWALRYVGVREKALRVRVSGHVQGSGVNYSITSRGDNTNFVLFNRAVPVDPPQYVNMYNPSNRILSKEIIAKLEEAKKGNRIVVIDGPIFMPERSPPDPLRLVVENISVEETKTKQSPNQKTPQIRPYGTSQN